MRGELYINGQDAWQTWGITMDDTSLSALMTPPANKDFPKNSSRLESGARYITINPKRKERDVTLSLQFVAETKALFLEKYNAFCQNVLATGKVSISTMYQSGVTYYFIYNSCTQYRQFLFKVAKFSLRLTEYNPDDRDDGNTNDSITI